jgi:hypothetical protein
MIVTFTISKNNPTQVDSLLGLGSLSVRMILFFFIILSNLTSLSAKTSTSISRTYPPFVIKEINTKKIPKNLKSYTVFLVKKFPTINVTIDNLNTKEEYDSANYDELFSKNINSSRDIQLNSTEKNTTKNNTTKIIPKLNL